MSGAAVITVLITGLWSVLLAPPPDVEANQAESDETESNETESNETESNKTGSTAVLPPMVEGDCSDSVPLAIFTSPRWPDERHPMRIMVVSEEDHAEVGLALQDAEGNRTPLTLSRYGGPPFGWVATIEKPRQGRYRLVFGSQKNALACQKIRVRKRAGRAPVLKEGEDPVWRARIKWERDTENLFSLWVEHLFERPDDDEPTWRPLHEALRNADKNLLYDHLNLGEDGPGNAALRLSPDCADFPYFLRGYFAWKLGLPFAFRSCSRGTTTRAPSCSDELYTNQLPAESRLKVRAFERFIRRECGGRVHSSSGRTLPETDRSDYYPVEMTRRGIRPGTIFADPYGHILVVASWRPQRDGKPGILFAVDAQPDATVGRRRFWQGSFLFPEDGAVKGAGFKRFRPLWKKRRPNGERAPTGSRFEIRSYSNGGVDGDRDYGDFSTEQWSMGKEAFYERMDVLINPEPMKPEVFFRAALDALTEQVRRRVKSVDAGEQYKRDNPGRTIDMPEGTGIFQTAGPWEDYSTPSRDLRLLIAIQSVIDYPTRVEKYPKRFILPAGKPLADVAAALRDQLMREAAERTFTYTRSDGSEWTLTVADVINRRVSLEVAYNPNDCPEIRWGAPADSDERSTCKARAPAAQTERMGQYRSWFAKRRRPVE